MNHLLEYYRDFGGTTSNSALVKNILNYYKVDSDIKLTEEIVFGIGGGIGFSHKLWDFKNSNEKILVLGFQSDSNSQLSFIKNVSERMGAKVLVSESDSTKDAAAKLEKDLESGNPAIVWVDEATLTYNHESRKKTGWFGKIINVFGVESDRVYIDDLSQNYFIEPLKSFQKARDEINIFKNRGLTIDVPRDIQISEAIKEGIVQCSQKLGESSDFDGLSGLKSWIESLNNSSSLSWNRVFQTRSNILPVLISVYESIECKNVGRGANRNFYAEFLSQSKDQFFYDEISEIEDIYRESGRLWTLVANCVLPDSSKEMKSVKDLIEEKYQVFKIQGFAGSERHQKVSNDLESTVENLSNDFPIDESKISAIISETQAQLMQLYDLEKSALKKLVQLSSKIKSS
jgi:hypothetical protein